MPPVAFANAVPSLVLQLLGLFPLPVTLGAPDAFRLVDAVAVQPLISLTVTV